MKRALLAAFALVAVPAALAAVPQTVTAPAPVTGVAADGTRVAYATGFSATDCNRVYVWNVAKRSFTRLGRKTHCERTSTGNAIASLSLAGTRALWLHYVGGNQRDWTLWTATTSRPSPVRVRSAATEAGDPAPIVIGPGDGASGGLLPYAVGRQVYALRANGSRAFAWTAPVGVTALGANAGRVVVGRADGNAAILDARGRVVRELALGGGTILAAFAWGKGAVLQRSRELVVVDDVGEITTYPLPAGMRLTDAEGSYALAVTSNRIVRRIVLRSGAQQSYGKGSSAQIEPAQVAIGWGRTVRVLPAG